MKVRNGFVSNSSSSSFIVFKPGKKYTKESLRDENYVKTIAVEMGYGIDDLAYVRDKINQIIENAPDSSFDLYFGSVEYGGEEDISALLNDLEIPYIWEEQ
jgi:hypothetical protein